MNEQVKQLNEVLLHKVLFNEVVFKIYSSFIPNKDKTIRPHQAPWITGDKASRQNLSLEKNSEYEGFVRNDRPDDELEGIPLMISERATLIAETKWN